MKAIFKLPENNIKASFSIPAGGGTYDYERLRNKPSINDVELIGNKTSEELGLASSQQGLLADSALQPNDNISELVNNVGYITGITSSDIQTALGYIPYSAENPSGFITISALNGYATENWVGQQGYLTSSDLLGYATEQWVNNQGFIKGINNTDVISALGYTPYDNSNPAGYITSESLPTVNNSTITIQKNGSDIESFNLNQPTNETINITVPTQTSDLTNNSGFITNTVNNLTNYYLKSETYTKTEVQQLIASIPQFSVVVVQTLPVTGERMVLYLVPKEGASPDVYNEYIWIEADEDYELIGNTAIDLTDYVQFTDLATVATTGDYDDLIDKPIPPIGYGTSSTAGGTATKVISIPEITELNVGQVIIVKPSTTSSVANSKIKLNDFEAYNMRYNNANVTTSIASIVWTANVVSTFIFDGTYWQFSGHGLEHNTTYASMSVNEGITGTATAQRSLTATNLKEIIQGTKLKGLVTTNDADVVASDSITKGIGKLQAQSTETKSILNDKQDTLVSGTNIKTINNQSIIGSGNINISGGTTYTAGNGIDITNNTISIDNSVVATQTNISDMATQTWVGNQGYLTSSALTNYVTTDTVQDITAEKTFIGDKAISFKQASTTDKLGFTLFSNTNSELAAFEFRPSTIGSSALFNLNLQKTSANYVGFRYHGTNAINVACPKVATGGNYYIPINFTNGTNTVTSNNVGTVNISTLIPTIATSVSSSSTNAQTVGAKLFYDTVGNIETLLSNV